MNLLIHADPGARGGFLASWLTDKLTSADFDSGLAHQPNFHKIHKLTDQTIVTNFPGIKIRIRPTLTDVDLLTLLFLRKTVHVSYPEFTKDEYSLETFTKLAVFSKEIFQWDNELDYSTYDYVIDFRDTFNSELLQNLYFKINNKYPANELVDVMIQTNTVNQLPIDKNHACSILKMIMVKESELNLKEEHRFWSIVDWYNNTPIENLYDAVCSSIIPENYGILLK